MSALRLAVVADLIEEGWPSMDLVSEMLVRSLEGHPEVTASLVRPSLVQIFGRVPGLGAHARNADRLVNRFWHYPRHLSRRMSEFDAFHVVDHSYAQLVHVLPAERTGVFCHDVDTFRCLVDPAAEPRPRWFRAMARRILRGLERAAVVFHSTDDVRALIERHGLVDPARLVKAPYGVAPDLAPEEDGGPLPREVRSGRYLLHVGSCIARKRIDVLLETFARVRESVSELHLVQVGGEWTREQRAVIDARSLGSVVVQLRDLSRAELARLYRRAALVLVPSEREGFGLPVIEALACGAPVLASDLPVLREVGGQAVGHVPVGDVAAWTRAVVEHLSGAKAAPDRASRVEQARRYRWEDHARTIAARYRGLVDPTSSRP